MRAAVTHAAEDPRLDGPPEPISAPDAFGSCEARRRRADWLANERIETAPRMPAQRPKSGSGTACGMKADRSEAITVHRHV